MTGDVAESFGGIVRLYGAAGIQRLQTSRVLVIGLGGVGTWVAEGLVRSGVGHLGLVDGDDFCISNINRQLHALPSTVGRSKVEVVAERCREINPQVGLSPEARFLFEASLAGVLDTGWDCVVDAVDNLRLKVALAGACRQRGLPLVVSGGAGGRRNPAAVRVDDLSRTLADPLLRQMRKRLRREQGFPRQERRKFGIHCVYSTEAPVFGWNDGSVHNEPEPGQSTAINCSTGLGTSAPVTGVFGLLCAGVVLELLDGKSDGAPQEPPAR